MPTHPNDEVCTERITFRCTPKMKAAMEQAAKNDKRKLSQWIMTQLQVIMEIPEEGSIVSRDPLILREVKKGKSNSA